VIGLTLLFIITVVGQFDCQGVERLCGIIVLLALQEVFLLVLGEVETLHIELTVEDNEEAVAKEPVRAVLKLLILGTVILVDDVVFRLRVLDLNLAHDGCGQLFEFGVWEAWNFALVDVARGLPLDLQLLMAPSEHQFEGDKGVRVDESLLEDHRFDLVLQVW